MHPSNGYDFGTEPGRYKVTLEDKVWGNSKQGGYIRLYFAEAATARKFYLSVFWPDKYCPTNGGPSFKDEVEIGEKLSLEIGRTTSGKPKFLSAEKGWTP